MMRDLLWNINMIQGWTKCKERTEEGHEMKFQEVRIRSHDFGYYSQLKGNYGYGSDFVLACGVS